MSTLSTFLKSIVKKIPPIKAIIAERDELRLRLKLSNRNYQHMSKHPTLRTEKLDLIDFAFSSQDVLAFADLGGIWGVEGGYTFYALDTFNPSKAVLVDTHPSAFVRTQNKKYPQLRFIEGDFGDKLVSLDVGRVDVVFLFDVLLHQVAPNWDEVLELYSHQTRYFIIFNPQWIGSSSTVRLLDFGEDGYFERVPRSKNEPPYDTLFQKLDQKHRDHDRTWRDAHQIWQWGITDDDLLSKMKSLGFRLQYYKNCGRFGILDHFENHAFVFRS